MIQAKPTIVELDMDELEEILRRLDAKELARRRLRDDQGGDRVLCRTWSKRWATRTTTIRRLRQMLFGAKTEKTAAVVGGKTESQRLASRGEDASPELPGQADATTDTAAAEARPGDAAENESAATGKGKGHGRNGADAYTGAEKIEVRHESLAAGRSLPEVRRGHGLRHAPPGRAGAAGGPGARGGQGLLSAEAALQSLRRGLHRRAAGGRGRGEVRRDGREHDCPAEIRQRDAVPPRRRRCKRAWAFPCPPRRSGTSSRPRRSVSSRSSKNWSGKRPKATWSTTTTRRSRSWS